MGKLTLDLHPIFNNSSAIDQALTDAIERAANKNIKEVEIITGKGSGQLKARVLKFLDRPDIKPYYKRLKKDFKNSGRVFLYTR
jgi:DNA-nicking Smr family endonuclease